MHVAPPQIYVLSADLGGFGAVEASLAVLGPDRLRRFDEVARVLTSLEQQGGPIAHDSDPTCLDCTILHVDRPVSLWVPKGEYFGIGMLTTAIQPATSQN
jgi:hypothetical protein